MHERFKTTVVLLCFYLQNNSLACVGKYVSAGDKGAAAGDSLFVANHAY